MPSYRSTLCIVIICIYRICSYCINQHPASPTSVFTYQRKTSKPPIEGSNSYPLSLFLNKPHSAANCPCPFLLALLVCSVFFFLFFFTTRLLTSLQTSSQSHHFIVQKKNPQDGRRSYTERSPRAETLDGSSYLVVDASSSRSRLHTSKA